MQGDALERALAAGDIDAARRAIEEGKRRRARGSPRPSSRRRPSSFVERRVIAYASERLEEGADPADVLAELEAARDEIDDWIELEEQHGIAEVMKLLMQWLVAGWEGHERVPAACWMPNASPVLGPEGREGVAPVIDPALRGQRSAADAVFNFWRA